MGKDTALWADRLNEIQDSSAFPPCFKCFSPLNATKSGKRGNNMALCGNKTKPITTHIPLSTRLLHQMWQ